MKHSSDPGSIMVERDAEHGLKQFAKRVAARRAVDLIVFDVMLSCTFYAASCIFLRVSRVGLLHVDDRGRRRRATDGAHIGVVRAREPRIDISHVVFVEAPFRTLSILNMTMMLYRCCLLLACLLLHRGVNGFAPIQAHARSSSLYMSFFKEIFSSAFENDPTLSKDKSKGQLEGPGDEDSSYTAPTSVQQRWRESTTSSRNVNAQLLENTTWTLELYLAGVATKDPSNDLYGSKVNISSRDRKVGLNLPDKPSVSVEVEFLPDGVCKAMESPFTTGQIDGQWKLSDDGTMIRFSMDVVGYSRTVQTKGSITNVFWSKEVEKMTETSSTYSIPPGIIYADAELTSGSKPGVLTMKDGILRVEQTTGLLGAVSKMVNCGGFTAKQV